jgi:alkyldihydroxyacetonephosphate synthase
MLAMAEAALSPMLGIDDVKVRPRPTLDELTLPAPRIAPPSALARVLSNEPFERALHSYGRSYRDLVRCFDRNFDDPPDWVAFPTREQDVVDLLDWAQSARVAVFPFGGGSSVCGGVEPIIKDGYHATLSLDLTRLSRVLEVDERSRAARIQAGALGPVLEEQLKPHQLTLRHYPQSFEFSTLGGWIATRAGGHFATLYTHIDELVEALRVVTPAGVLETRRLPGSGAGPSPERLFIGSEGTLGVITEAWMRVFPRPRFRAKASVRFADFAGGAEALRSLAQSGLYPANCRLVDPLEAMLNGAGSGDSALLLLGFESADHPVDAWMARALELCRDAGGQLPEAQALSAQPGDGEASSAWRDAFLRAPYLRDELVARGVFVETYETAVTWDRFDRLHRAVMEAARAAGKELGVKVIITCRVTHAYPDGAAPYFTVLAKALTGHELRQWDVFKRAITDAMLAAGGTTTHHHAVGRDFRPWYQQERPDLFESALKAAKGRLDPRSVLNPGVLLDA